MIDDRAYLYQRAETELALAQTATDPKVTAIHYKLAEAYLSRLSSAPEQVPSS